MATILYGINGSPYVRAARLGLVEKGVPYDFADMPFGTIKDPANLARHPFARIPSFEHDDFMLYETQAILRYVDEAFPGPALQPTDPRRRARMNQVIGIVDCYVFPSISAGISRHRVISPRLNRAPDEAAIEAALPRARICLDALSSLIGDEPYFAGDRISLADLMLAPHMLYFAMTPEGGTMLEDHPRLTRWVQRFAERASIAQTKSPFG